LAAISCSFDLGMMLHIDLINNHMIETIEDSITQYAEAWNVAGTENIKAALKDCWTPESTYYDPQNELVTGLNGLADLIDSFHQQAPGHRLYQTSKVDAHHYCGRFLWENVDPNGKKIVGMDYFEFNDQNQVTRIVGFFGPFTDL
jgi:hypothetical protein